MTETKKGLDLGVELQVEFHGLSNEDLRRQLTALNAFLNGQSDVRRGAIWLNGAKVREFLGNGPFQVLNVCQPKPVPVSTPPHCHHFVPITDAPKPNRQKEKSFFLLSIHAGKDDVDFLLEKPPVVRRNVLTFEDTGQVYIIPHGSYESAVYRKTGDVRNLPSSQVQEFTTAEFAEALHRGRQQEAERKANQESRKGVKLEQRPSIFPNTHDALPFEM